MFRAIPTPNKILDKKWQKLQMERLKYRIETMRPTIETRKTLSNFRSSKRREKPFIIRCQQIERDNKILLDKMSKIMQPSSSANTSPRKILTGVNEFKDFEKRKRSLNKDSRKKELIRVTIENQALLKRIMELKPSYKVNKMLEEYKERTQLVKNICEYPFCLHQGFSTHRRSASVLVDDKSASTPKLPKIASQKAMFRWSLIKAKRQLTVGEMMVELVVKKRKLQIIAYDEGKTEAYVTEVPEDKTIEIIDVFNGNYEALANCIDIVDGRLIIVRPNE